MPGEAGRRLAAAGIADFETLWSVAGTRVDEPNRRGSGSSEVVRLELAGDGAVFYLKRQQDYFPRSRLAPRRLLLEREHRALERFRRSGVPVLDTAAFAVSTRGGSRRGVLATVGLVDHVPLDTVMAMPARLPDGLLVEVAKCLGAMHRRRLAHGNLYPKHVFVHRELAAGGAPDDPVRIIDLEDAHRVPLARYAAVRDLEKLDRYSEGLSDFRRLRFFLRYLGVRRASTRQRRLLEAIARRRRRALRRRRAIG